MDWTPGARERWQSPPPPCILREAEGGLQWPQSWPGLSGAVTPLPVAPHIADRTLSDAGQTPRALCGHQDAETGKLVCKPRFRGLTVSGCGSWPGCSDAVSVTAKARLKNVSLVWCFSGRRGSPSRGLRSRRPRRGGGAGRPGRSSASRTPVSPGFCQLQQVPGHVFLASSGFS